MGLEKTSTYTQWLHVNIHMYFFCFIPAATIWLLNHIVSGNTFCISSWLSSYMSASLPRNAERHIYLWGLKLARQDCVSRSHLMRPLAVGYGEAVNQIIHCYLLNLKYLNWKIVICCTILLLHFCIVYAWSKINYMFYKYLLMVFNYENRLTFIYFNYNCCDFFRYNLFQFLFWVIIRCKLTYRQKF